MNLPCGEWEGLLLRKWLGVLTVLVLCAAGLFTLSASAENTASRADLYCTVNADGDCLVSLSVTIHLDAGDDSLTFPLPPTATSITMNGYSAATTRSSSAILVNLSRATNGLPGDFTIRFDYMLPDVVYPIEGRKLQMTLPLMNGFSYPVTAMSYVITMPSEITTTPSFTSTYRQNGIDADLDYVIKDNMITGSIRNGLNDHESFSLTMPVEQEMFPTVSTYQRTGNPEVIPMLAVLGAALLYWLLFLRTLPPPHTTVNTPPEGVTAGELGCRLTLQGGDLSMLVLSWAQLGYLLIHQDGNGRILLHKRMDMGNERSLFEVRIFGLLFGTKRVVDCSSVHYARLCRKTAGMLPGEKTMCRSHPAHRKVFRLLCCASQSICGVCLTMNLTSLPALEVLLGIVLGVLGAVFAWQIQNIAYTLFLRRKTGAWVGLGCLLVWTVVGIIAAVPLIALGSAAAQVAAGFLAAYGGRRTSLNKTEASQILGLRRYLKKIPKQELDRRMKVDPEYFFRMAPYALAMGVMKPYAAAFGKRKLPQCPYLVTQVHTKRTAAEWADVMTGVVTLMDSRYRQMEADRWTAIRLR